MGEVHRVGCRMNANCNSRTVRNVGVRAVFYARFTDEASGRLQTAFFCEACGRAFGHARGVPVTVHA